VFGVELNDTFDQSDVDSLSTDLAVPYKAAIVVGGTYQGIRVLEGAEGGDYPIWESGVGGGAGTKTGATMTPQVQGLIKKTSGLATRQGIGRTFVPDMSEANISDAGLISGTQATQLANFASDVFASFNNVAPNPWGPMVLLHSNERTPDRVVAYTAQTKVATLRPRYVR
jgi:hypothetical protein